MTSDALSSSMLRALLLPVHGTSIEHISRQLEKLSRFSASLLAPPLFTYFTGKYSTLKANLLAFAEADGHDIVITNKRRSTWGPCTANALC